jgi:hypothetical protein
VSIKGVRHLLQIVKSDCGTQVAYFARKYAFESSIVVLAANHQLKIPSLCNTFYGHEWTCFFNCSATEAVRDKFWTSILNKFGIPTYVNIS